MALTKPLYNSKSNGPNTSTKKMPSDHQRKSSLTIGKPKEKFVLSPSMANLPTHVGWGYFHEHYHWPLPLCMSNSNLQDRNVTYLIQCM